MCEIKSGSQECAKKKEGEECKGGYFRVSTKRAGEDAIFAAAEVSPSARPKVSLNEWGTQQKTGGVRQLCLVHLRAN